jgi:putative oxidoreductase
MAFAYFMGHASNGFFPKQNQGELAVIYCWFALYLAAAGPGAWSVDGLMPGKRTP